MLFRSDHGIPVITKDGVTVADAIDLEDPYENLGAQLCKQVSKKTNKPVLILAPLAVSGQTISEAKRFGLHCEKIKSDIFGFGVYITNYEQLDNLDCSIFSGIVLDESSILKNFTGKTKNYFRYPNYTVLTFNTQ